MRWIAAVLTGFVIVAAGCGKSTVPTAPPEVHGIPLLPGPAGPGDDFPSWSPDGSLIAYHHVALTDEERAQYGAEQVWAYTVATGAQAYLTAGWHPSWSPDGKALLVARATGLFIVSLTDHTERQLTKEEPAGGTWSPDGQHIAFMTIFDNPPGSQGIYVIGADGTGLTQVASSAQDPSWSPDGTQILHVRWDIPEQGQELFTMSPDGQNLTSLTSGRGLRYRPAWSRDGRSIAYDVDGKIATMNADGTDVREIGDQVLEPCWSPDGTQIVCTKLDSRAYKLYLAVMNADGSNPRFLTGPSAGTP